MKLDFRTNIILHALLGNSTVVLASGSSGDDAGSISAIEPHIQKNSQNFFLRLLPRAIIHKPKVPDSTTSSLDNTATAAGDTHPPPRIGGAADGTSPSSPEAQPHIGAGDDASAPNSGSSPSDDTSNPSPRAGEDAPPAQSTKAGEEPEVPDAPDMGIGPSATQSNGPLATAKNATMTPRIGAGGSNNSTSETATTAPTMGAAGLSYCAPAGVMMIGLAFVPVVGRFSCLRLGVAVVAAGVDLDKSARRSRERIGVFA